jgi:hypothetical protein
MALLFQKKEDAQSFLPKKMLGLARPAKTAKTIVVGPHGPTHGPSCLRNPIAIR